MAFSLQCSRERSDDYNLCSYMLNVELIKYHSLPLQFVENIALLLGGHCTAVLFTTRVLSNRIIDVLYEISLPITRSPGMYGIYFLFWFGFSSVFEINSYSVRNEFCPVRLKLRFGSGIIVIYYSCNSKYYSDSG